MTDELLTPAMVAEILHVPVSRVQGMIRGGAFTVVRLGPRTVRIPVAAFEAWVTEQTEPSREREAEAQRRAPAPPIRTPKKGPLRIVER